jgi:hypothetical protein
LVSVLNGDLSLIVSMIIQDNVAGSESTEFETANVELRILQRVAMDVVKSDVDK